MMSLDLSEPELTADALLGYDHDPEACSACDAVDDICPYHRGVEDGRALFAQAVAAMNSEPDLANWVPAHSPKWT